MVACNRSPRVSSDPSHAPEPLLTWLTGFSKSAGAARSPPRARSPPTTLTWTWTWLGGERWRSCASTSWSRGGEDGEESSGWWSVRDWGGSRLAAGEARAAGAGSGPRSESHQVLGREQQRGGGVWQLQPHTNPPIDWIPTGLRVTMSRQSRSTRQPQQPRAGQRLPSGRDVVEVVVTFSSGRELAGRATSASHPFSGGGRV